MSSKAIIAIVLAVAGVAVEVIKVLDEDTLSIK
jgi:hypothetical protein